MNISRIIKENKDLMLVILSNSSNIGFFMAFWFFGAFFLPKEYYGEISFILSVSYLATSIAIFGFSFGILIFGSEEFNHNIIQTFNSLVFFLSIIIGLIVGILQRHIWEYLLIILGQTIFLIVPCNKLAKREYKKYSLWLFLCSGSKLMLSLFGMYFYLNPLVISILYTLPPYFMGKNFYYNSIKGICSFEFSKFRKNLKEITILGGIAINRNFISYLDKIIIGFWLGIVVLGDYQFIFQIYLLLQFLPSAIQSYLIPINVKKSAKQSTIYLSILFSIILSILTIISSDVVINWLFPKFIDVIPAIYTISLCVPIATLASINISRLMAYKKLISILLIYISALIIQYIAILLIVPILNLQGFSIALLLNQALLLITSTLLLKRFKSTNLILKDELDI